MPTAELDALLDRERRALRAGDVAALAALADDKARLAEALADLPPDRMDSAALGRLRAAARHNDRMLAAALSGLRTARAKLDAARRGGVMETYDQGGRRQTIGAAIRQVERKA
ncbi:MAG: hypothetical protein JKP98_01625 [Rhodobacteraceae bacterium]|jgi:hypothetical protein|nr:hypothetical protein [Paracoccaceae bacterium]MBL4556371.1 hypothetical protein [Paracoccaceae bacterium]HBG98193.1 hypothetical protein [Paracoccaceae bacterium]